MKKIYIEFLKELYIRLEQNRDLMWSEWMKRSIKKFDLCQRASSKNINYTLQSF